MWISYSIIFDTNLADHKRYTLDNFFKHIGQFLDTIGISQFIFALLDNCDFERVCPLCSESHLDVLQHTLRGCSKAHHLRLLLKMKLELFNVPGHINLSSKVELFTLAVGKRLYRKVLCEYLISAS